MGNIRSSLIKPREPSGIWPERRVVAAEDSALQNALQRIHTETDARIIRIIDVYIRENTFYLEVLTNPENSASRYTWSQIVSDDLSEYFEGICSNLRDMIRYTSRNDAYLINDINDLGILRVIYNNRRRNRAIGNLAALGIFSTILSISILGRLIYMCSKK